MLSSEKKIFKKLEKSCKKRLTFLFICYRIICVESESATEQKRNAVVAQLVEHILGKDEVGSSNLLNSSRASVKLTDAFFTIPVHLCPCPNDGRDFSFCPKNYSATALQPLYQYVIIHI